METSTTRVLILGYGEMGHAMEHLLRPRHTVAIWQRRPSAAHVAVDLAAEAARADVVLFCLPAIPHFEIAAPLGSQLRPDAICLTLAKGLDDQGRVATRALSDAIGDRARQVTLYGPMIAEEILADHDAYACVGASHADTAARIVALFAGSHLHLRPSSDLIGLSWCGVLKNVYALLFGMADELALGDNVRGYLAVACTDELADIMVGLGGTRETATSWAGLGDLITTATSIHSRHHETGRRIARGETDGLECEGTHTLTTLHRHSVIDIRRFALLRLAFDCAHQPAQAASRLRHYLRSLS